MYPVLLRQEEELLLVDGGYAGFLPLLQEAAARHGLSLANLTGILITHHDIDHIGALHELKAAFPAAKVYASALEAPYVSGQRDSLRLQQAEALHASLPEEQKAWAVRFQEMLKAVRPVAVDVILTGNEMPAPLSGIELIPTPGHMPGHVSLYLPQSKTLIAADAVVVEQGELELANPAFTLDLEQALASVRKLQQLEVDRLICYHGGLVEKAIPEKLKRLVEKYAPAQQTKASADDQETDTYSSPACYAHRKEFREGF